MKQFIGVSGRLFRVLFIAAALVPVLAISAMAGYTITDLGMLGVPNGSDSFSFGLGINNSGQVVGYSNTGEGADHAFLYSSQTGMKDIGTLGGGLSYGYGINDSGQVTGCSLNTGNAAYHAFIYGTDTGMKDLGAIANGTSMGYGINNSGQVTGYSYAPGTNGPYHAFLYSSGAGMQDIGTLGGTGSAARGINDSGQVTGYSNLPGDATYHAFVYSAASGMKDLGTLGGNSSDARAINNSGQVTGYALTANGASHAFIYSNGKMTDLGTLGGSYISSFGYGINKYGQVVGCSGFAGDVNSAINNRPFLYSEGQMTDLNALLSPSSGWTLTEGLGINDLGQITGTGMFNGHVQAFLMTPDNVSPTPIPPTVYLFGVGLASLIGLKKKRIFG